MAAIDDFMSRHPELSEEDSVQLQKSNGARLEVSIRGISSSYVRFAYMGTEYSVMREKVLDVIERHDGPDPAAATIVVDRDSPLTASYSVTAAELESAIPFTLTAPPSAAEAPIRLSDREVAWRRETGYEGAGRYPSLETYLSPYGTATGSPSRTAGGWDDSVTDDQRTDY